MLNYFLIFDILFKTITCTAPFKTILINYLVLTHKPCFIIFHKRTHILHARKEEIFHPADFTSFDITIHVILWCAIYHPPCIFSKKFLVSIFSCNLVSRCFAHKQAVIKNNKHLRNSFFSSESIAFTNFLETLNYSRSTLVNYIYAIRTR